MSKNKNAFSLIELLVVISIMAILAGIGYISFRTARATARDGRRLADLKNIQTAVETYAADHNGIIPCGASKTTYRSYVPSQWGAGAGGLSNLLGQYYSSQFLPEDPLKASTVNHYVYTCDPSTQSYVLRAKMERNKEVMEDDHGCRNTCTNINSSSCWWEIGTDLTLDCTGN